MKLISYAQNMEDVMLWRALKHIDKGFYIDAGAWSPNLDSVTKLFYDKGWHGINIEPNPEYHAQLEESRQNDINLCVAISDQSGFLEMNFVENPGLSTLDDKIAQTHLAAGWKINKQPVTVITLAAVWKEHLTANQEVHFLKIDVEGFEKAVLRGNDWKHCRPWIIVIEATLPMSQEESHSEWENILLSADYQYAYADGLNRFYVAQEHTELLSAFKYPPNVFDQFLLSTQEQAEEKAQQAKEQVREVREQTKQAQEQTNIETKRAKLQIEQLHQQVQQTSNTLQAVYNSRSWRLTAPLRWFNHQAKLLRQHGLAERTKTLVKKISQPILRRAIILISAHPNLRRRVINLAGKLGLSSFLRASYFLALRHPNSSSLTPPQKFMLETNQLTLRAQKIHTALKAAVEHQGRKNI